MKKIIVVSLLIVFLLSPMFSIISNVRAEDSVINPSTAPQDFKPQKSGCIYAGSDVLVIQDAYTWGLEQLYNAPDGAACSDLGISYDVITSTAFETMSQLSLQSYKAVVLMADQPQTFYENIYAYKQKLADYVNAGGVLSAVVYTGWIGYVVTEQFLPGGVSLNFAYTDHVSFDPNHFIISDPDDPVSLQGPWGYNTVIDNIRMASSFYFTNLPSGAATIAWDANGNSCFVEYPYGSGKVIAVGIPIEWFYRYKLGLGGTGCEPPWDGANNLKLLYNELTYQSGMPTTKDRLLAAVDNLETTIEGDIESLAQVEAYMDAIAYKNLQFETVKFIANVLIDFASFVEIGKPPTEVSDFRNLPYLKALDVFTTTYDIGTGGLDLGLCSLAADNYIKNRGLSPDDVADVQNAYYNYILGTAYGQTVQMPFFQGSQTFEGLMGLFDSLLGNYNTFKSTINSLPMPDQQSSIQLIQYINGLDNTLSVAVQVPNSDVHHLIVNGNKEQYKDNELGYLLNLKKQQAELVQVKDQAGTIDDACLITEGAALGVDVLAKVANVLSVGTLTALEIGVTILSTGASLIQTGASTVELSYKTLIAGNKLQSTFEMGSEVVRLKQIFEDTENYVIWRMKYSPPKVSGSIVSLNMPDVVTDGLFGTASGAVTVENDGVNPVTAIAYMHILGPDTFAQNKMMVFFTAAPPDGVEIAPGSQQTITFTYSVLDLSYILGCNQYEADIYVSLEGKLLGPSVKFFNAGLWCKSSSQTVLTGDISSSQTQSTTVTTDQTTVQDEFELSYGGSHLDLHVYDQQGNHVGVNYNTGEVETNIPGATYSGPQANPQWIKIPVTGGAQFQVAVAAVTVFGSESYTVTLIQLKNYYAPSVVLSSTHEEIPPGQTASFGLTVQNRGNMPDRIDLSLQGLDSTWFSLSDTTVSVDPDQMSQVTLTISTAHVPLIPNDYPFTLTATSEGDPSVSDSASATLTIVVLDSTPPATDLTVGDPKYLSGTTYVTPDTPFTLTATDAGSGVKLTNYRINSTSYDSRWLTYTNPFNMTSLSDGNYTITFNSTDNVENVETTHRMDVTLFSWNYVFKDSDGRGTTLKICTAYKFFEFIAPDKDFGVKYAPKMIRLCKQATIICYEDSQMKLAAIAADDKTCVAMACDKQTGKTYCLIEHPPTYSLSICCKDSNGKAISGASVYLNGCCKGRTDANGKLAITNIMAGTYTVTAKKCGYKDTSISVTISSDTTITITMK